MIIHALPTIHTYSIESFGPQNYGTNTLNLSTSATWPSANLALFIPFKVFFSYTATRMFAYNGATASGNIDIGIYSSQGNKLVSSGSTAQSGTNVLQEFDITDTVLVPGLYYMAVAMDNTTGTLFRNTTNLNPLRMNAIYQQASAFALPTTTTFAAMAQSYIPVIGMSNRSFL